MCLVSIIIPCYKQAHFLPRTLSSIATQDHEDIEVIIVDDGSPDPVVIPDGNWWFPIKLIRKENRGLSSARNTGIENANGRYFKFLDADDTLLSCCISSQVASMGGREDIISVIGYIIENEDTHLRETILPAFGDIREALLQINIGPPHCYLYSANLVRQVGGFCTSEKVNGGHEDYDFALRISAVASYGVTVHNLGAIYYKRIGSMSALFEPMTKTRVAVWSDNVLKIIRCTTKNNVSIILAAISGWLRLVESTPAHLSEPLHTVAEYLSREVSAISKTIPAEESSVLAEKLARINSKSSIILHTALCDINKTTSASVIHSQELIDRRVGISLTDTTSSAAEWLLAAVYAIHTYGKTFAVYGAGELGNTLASFLQQTHCMPVVFIDRNAVPKQTLRGIPVVTIDHAKNFQFEAILISSRRYITEIRQTVKSHLPNVDIIEPQLPT